MNVIARALAGLRKPRDMFRRDNGLSTLQLVIVLTASAIVIVTIAAVITQMIMGSRAATAKREQTAAVQDALQQIVRGVDESANIFHGTETQLGIARNISTGTGGGLNCQIDEYLTGADTVAGSNVALLYWTNTLTGACQDSYTWTVPPGGTSVLVHNLSPYTLVDDTGLTTAACTATADKASRGGNAGYCVPLFRYLDANGDEFAPTEPPAKNSISAVKIVVSGNYADKPVPISRSKTVTPNGYQPGTTIGEVATPMCPATLSRTLSGTNVTLTWAPVANATQYRVIRTYNGTTTTRATLSVASMSATANPSYVDSIAGMAATSIVYQVLPTVGGKEATACPQTIVSVQTTAPNVTVQVVGSTSAEWQGARSSDSTFTNWPSLSASWPAVAGASSYEAEIREMNPKDDSAPLTGWASFDWDGGSTRSNIVNGTSVSTNLWNGSRLWSRAFQVRVRAVSDAGSSPWTYCYMQPGSGVAGTCGQFPANSFPSSGINGYVVMPAPATITVDDVTRGTGNNVALSWAKSSTWTGAQYNGDSTFYRIQVDSHDGVNTAVSYNSGDYVNSTGLDNTTATSGYGHVEPGDWSNYRVLRCNSINPYDWGSLGATYSGTGNVQCGPASRVWTALGLPGVPAVSATVNSSANTNTVYWGKSGTTTTADYTAQKVDYYDVAEQQGGGAGTSNASGNSTTAKDTVDGTALTSPWQNHVAVTNGTHNRREGDFTRYRSRAANVTVNGASTPAWLAGTTGEAGQGVGVESTSDWNTQTGRYWQTVSVPACTATDDWNTITIAVKFSGVYVSPLDTVTSRTVTRYNTTEGVNWTSTSTANSNADWTKTYNDDESSADDALGTVKPLTNYRAGAGISTLYASTGSTTNCDSGTVNAPPIPDAPAVDVSLASVSGTYGTPKIKYYHNADDAPVVSNYVRRSLNGAAYATVANTATTTANGSWKTTYTETVRAAYSARLYSWGFYSSKTDSFTPNPANYGSGNGCPLAVWNYSTVSYKYTISATSWVGDNCRVSVTAGNQWDDALHDFYNGAINLQCADDLANGLPQADYCNNPAKRATQIQNYMNASSYTRTGDIIARLDFVFGVNVLDDNDNGYATKSYWPAVSSPSGSGIGDWRTGSVRASWAWPDTTPS